MPTFGSCANPIERAFGEGPDLCPHNHMRKRVWDLGTVVDAHLNVHGSWTYQLAALSDEPAVTATVENITAEEHTQVVA